MDRLELEQISPYKHYRAENFLDFLENRDRVTMGNLGINVELKSRVKVFEPKKIRLDSINSQIDSKKETYHRLVRSVFEQSFSIENEISKREQLPVGFDLGINYSEQMFKAAQITEGLYFEPREFVELEVDKIRTGIFLLMNINRDNLNELYGSLRDNHSIVYHPFYKEIGLEGCIGFGDE